MRQRRREDRQILFRSGSNANEAKPSRIGAEYLDQNRCRFRVWAPELAPIEVQLLNSQRGIRMEQTGRGYHEALISGVEPGERYLFRLPENKERPDPASRSQPDGVHGPDRKSTR